jgi:hypothetical protein
MSQPAASSDSGIADGPAHGALERLVGDMW